MSKAIRNRLDRVVRRADASSSASAAAWRLHLKRRHSRGLIRVAASEGKRDKAAERWLKDNPAAPDERRAAASFHPPKDYCAGLARRLRAAKEKP